MSNTSTPYDDAQRTLSVDCPSLLIPLVNEAFQTDYSKDESAFIFPHAAVLYLRTENTTPSSIKMRIVTPGGDVSYEIPVVKVQDYGLEEIFGKRLLFLLPYYFLRYQLEVLEEMRMPD